MFTVLEFCVALPYGSAVFASGVPYLGTEVRAAVTTHDPRSKNAVPAVTVSDRLAPGELEVPSGNRHALTYEIGKQPVLAVRMQELFGLAETPTVGGGRVPVLLHLLGPNHRPQQVTADLASFWKNGYPEVRKDLRGRYPRHYWPEDPSQAEPTRRVRPR